MIKVVAKQNIKEGMADQVTALCSKLIEETRKEAGCISYELFRDLNNSNVFMFIEEWESKQHLDAHMQTSHFKEIGGKLNDLRLSSEISILEKVE